MAGPLTEAAVEAVEKEVFATEQLPNFVQKFSKVRKMITERGKTIQASYQTYAGGISRPSIRQPFIAQAGGNTTQFPMSTPGNIPYFTRGTGPTTDSFAQSPFTFVSVGEVANDAMWAINGPRSTGGMKLPKDAVTLNLQAHEQVLDAACMGDSTGTFDTIPTTAVVNNGTGTGNSTSSIVGLNTAVAFTDQMVVQVYNGTTLRGTFTVSYMDPVTRTLYSAGALPAGTTNLDLLVVAGATGVANGSVSGLRAWHINTNVGTTAGVNRALYLGRLNTPTINLANTGGISPTFHHRIEAMRSRARGNDFNTEDTGFYIANPQAGISLVADYYGKEITTYSDGGSTVPDTAKKFVPKTYGGREIVYAEVQQPNRLDLLEGKNWVNGEMFDTRMHDFAPGQGMTMVPTPAIGAGSNATYYNSSMFTYETSFNLMCINPKDEFYATGIPVGTIN